MTSESASRIGRFRLVEPIGEGGMATVHLAWDERLEVWRALKLLSERMGSKRKIRIRFEGEARAMARLEHPNIVRIYDVGRDGKRVFIVMEWVRGGSLYDRVEDWGPLPPQLSVATLLQVCQAITHAHKHGIIHRDIKPHNVLLTPKGVCKVTDFGIARTDGVDVDLTRTGAAMGTLGYMAPEQRVDAKGADQRADVYGLGATLFYALTGRTTMDLHAAWQDESMLEGVPESLVSIILHATEFRRDKRYGSVLQLAAALKIAAKGLPPDPFATIPLVDPSRDQAPAPPPPTSSETFDTLATPPIPDDRQTILPPATPVPEDRTELPPTQVLERGVLPLPPTAVVEPQESDWDYAKDGVVYEELEGPAPLDIGLDDASRRATEELVARDVEESGEGEEAAEHKPLDPTGWWGMRMMLKFVVQIVVGFMKFMTGPGLHLAIPAVAITLIVSGLGIKGSVDLRDKRVGAEDAWHMLDQALEKEAALIRQVGELSHQQVMLSEEWAAYEGASDIERKREAHELVEVTTRTFFVDVERHHGKAVTNPMKLKLNKLTRLKENHVAAHNQWADQATTRTGRLAVGLRFSTRPEALVEEEE